MVYNSAEHVPTYYYTNGEIHSRGRYIKTINTNALMYVTHAKYSKHKLLILLVTSHDHGCTHNPSILKDGPGLLT